MTGFVCMPRVYEFDGWLFEFDTHRGPWPLRKDGTPRKRAGDKFWNMWQVFEMLTVEQQQSCLVSEGGCMPFTDGHEEGGTKCV